MKILGHETSTIKGDAEFEQHTSGAHSWMQSEQKWWPQEVTVRRPHTSRQIGQLPPAASASSSAPSAPAGAAPDLARSTRMARHTPTGGSCTS